MDLRILNFAKISQNVLASRDERECL